MGKWHLSMDPVQEWGEEQENGAVFGITLRREPVLQNSDTTDLPSTSSFVQYHTVKVRRLKAGNLEHLVTELLNPESQELDFIHIFLSTYRAFTSTSTVIELLFQRYDSTANPDNTVSSRSTLPPVIRLWLEEYSKDFHEPSHYQALRLLCANLRRRLCFRRLAHTAEALLKRLQETDCSQSASAHHNESLQQEHGDLEDRVEKSTEDEDKYNFMLFPVREVAEQLTRLDAELFVRVIPFDCLGCVWSQRDKKENRNIAPTVRATISQFNAVTNRVITSLLCPSTPGPSTSSPASSPGSSSTFLYPSTAPSSPRCARNSPALRASIIERWIAVAQECRQLKNFSSLRAILSALQSNAVYRLKKTWAAVSRESMATLDHLCETFLDENCVLTSKEDLMEDGSLPDGISTPGSKSTQLCSATRQTNSSSGVVPYLGTYLTVFTMLDTALSDNVEGGLINFEKRRREFEIISQIRQFQTSCSAYKLPVNTHITTWLRTHALLTDQESYELSRDLEPPVDPCPNSPNSWSSRLLTKKLTTLRSSSDCSLRKTHADQISVSSSGSSSSDIDDLSAPQSTPLRLKLKSFSGSLHNVAEDSPYSSMSISPSLSNSSCSSSQPDLSSSSLLLSHDSSSSSCSSPPAALPLYNKQVADSCIIRVSVECVSNGNIYKSILLTSQDHTPQVIQRALEKHNMEDISCRDFSLCQMLNNGKELQIPDNANVYYAMSTSANFDFVLRPRWRRHLGSVSSPATLRKNRHAKWKSCVLDDF
ncbi:ral guanine nucleotide dissociation stimulator-like 1 isoform X2 [Notolabrus celidotus]|uniref:ral guanine nucleotide dissociation stimulator-like 1 isoform X2 n=1 Tax=Notolabrus celidotus TaxID=1203425 RepID=UPI00148FC28A|nr:ral guanine nucleotide dissociation stimulator-like 1 isoform X2 [Notolabrus celidotus]